MRLEPPADDYFYQKFLDLEDRFANVLESAHPERSQLLGAALEELKTSLEELHVAHEELQNQNRELELAHFALEAERQRYLELIDLSPDGYLITSNEGVVREANRAASNLLGLSPQFLVGKPLLLFIAPEDRRDFNFQLCRLGQHQQPTEFEARLRPREGVVFPARFTVNPARDPSGNMTGLRWLVRDGIHRNGL